MANQVRVERKERKKAVNGKAKGNRFELEIAKLFTTRFGKVFKRVPQSGAFATVNKDADMNAAVKEGLAGDIIVPEGFRFGIECKARKDFNFFDMISRETEEHDVKSWIRQALDEKAITKKPPLIIVKINGRKVFALVEKEVLETDFVFRGFSFIRLDYLLEREDDFFWEK